MSKRVFTVMVLLCAPVLVCAGPKSGSIPIPKSALDKQLVVQIRKVVKRCQSGGSLKRRCKLGEALGDALLDSAHRAVKVRSLITLVELLHDRDRLTRQLVASLFVFTNPMDRTLQGISKHRSRFSRKFTARLLAGLQRSTRFSERVAGIASQLATIYRMTARVLTIAKNHPQRHVYHRVLGYLMRYGRLRVFPIIRKIGNTTDEALVLSAINSVRSMFPYNDHEQKVVCTFLAPYLKHKLPAVVDAAMSTLVFCAARRTLGESYAALLLREGKRRVLARQWNVNFIYEYSELCFPGQDGKADVPPKETCRKHRTFFEWIVARDSVPSKRRVDALKGMAYQWPDQKSYLLVKKYTVHADRRLRRAARSLAAKLLQKLRNPK